MKAWVVIDVGCHECGVGSEVVGAFLTEAEATAAESARDDQTNGWRDGGQTVCTVFEVDVPAGPSESPGNFTNDSEHFERTEAMNTYWDLSESDRAALSSDDVQRYVDAELMLKGVLKVKPFVMEPVPTVPTPTTKAFVVRFGGKYGRQDSGVVFTTLEAAQAFVALRPMTLGSEYLESTSVPYTSTVGDPEIAEVPIFTEEAKNAVRGELRKSAAIKAANEKAAEEYAKAARAQESALEGLWEDWTRCRAEAAKLREVADTYEDYKRTAGDEQIAVNFLNKVYPPDLIAEAAKRFAIPTTFAAATP